MVRKKDIDIVIMRILAAFAVVMTHVIDISSIESIFMVSLTRFCVPIFVITSGYYMLNSKNKMSKIARKCGKLFATMIVWAGIYYLFEVYSGKQSFVDMENLLTYLLTQPAHLYYIYVAVTLYLFTPILYVFCANATKKEYEYALGLTFLLGSIVTILLRTGDFSILQTVIDKMKVPYTQGFIFLYMMGGYLQRYPIKSKQQRYKIYLFGILGILITFLGTLLLSQDGPTTDLLFSFFAPNAMIEGVAIFIFVKQVCNSYQIKSDRLYSFVCEIGQCTFGIYLLHPLVIMIVESKIDIYIQPVSTYIGIMSETIICFLVSLILVLILKRILGFRWLIR